MSSSLSLSSSSAPSSGNGAASSNATGTATKALTPSHAVSRTAELLACAKTALRIAQSEWRSQQEQQQQVQEGRSAATCKSSAMPLHQALQEVSPEALQLYDSKSPAAATFTSTTSSLSQLEDALQLVQSLDATLSELGLHVRQRGHTNDPSLAISQCVSQFQSLAQEVVAVVESLKACGKKSLRHVDTGVVLSKRLGQFQKHYEWVADGVAKELEERMTQFQHTMKLRSEILQEKQHRRKLLIPSSSGGASAPLSGGGGKAAAAAATFAKPATPLQKQPPPISSSSRSQLQSPLFAGGAATTKTAPLFRPPPPNGSGYPVATQTKATTGAQPSNNGKSWTPPTTTTTTTTTGTSGYYGGYGGGYGGYGGGGYGMMAPDSSSGTSMGMRRRVGGTAANAPKTTKEYNPYDPANHDKDDNHDDKDHDDTKKSSASAAALVQQRRRRREAKSRLESARQAEQSLAELGTVFHQMSTLVAQQDEALLKIEDDVEAAHVDVTAGQEELGKLYQMTKGNRGLILKVFGVLIFFIIFMKLY